MSYTDLEYRLVKFHGLHRYDAFANPDKVGLGRCGCGEDMYYCEHDTHIARALIAELGLREERGGPGDSTYDRWQERAVTSVSDVAWDTHTLRGSTLRPLAETQLPMDLEQYMREVWSAIAHYRQRNHRDPAELRLSPDYWDMVVSNTDYYPPEAEWPHERKFYNPAKQPRHGTLFGIKASSDPSVDPGRIQLT